MTYEEIKSHLLTINEEMESERREKYNKLQNFHMNWVGFSQIIFVKLTVRFLVFNYQILKRRRKRKEKIKKKDYLREKLINTLKTLD